MDSDTQETGKAHTENYGQAAGQRAWVKPALERIPLNEATFDADSPSDNADTQTNSVAS